MVSRKSQRKATRKAIIQGTRRHNEETKGGRKDPTRLSKTGRINRAKRENEHKTKTIKDTKISRIKKGETLRPHERIVAPGWGLGRAQNKPVHAKKPKQSSGPKQPKAKTKRVIPKSSSTRADQGKKGPTVHRAKAPSASKSRRK